MENKDKMNIEKYLKRINERSEDHIICVNKNCLYILIDKNITKAILCEPVYPYSNQWGAYCPFERLYKKENDNPDILEGNKEYMEKAIEIKELNDIKNINEILIEKGYCT